MNGVDRCDQYLASYTFCRKTIKWWKKIFIRVFELSVINAMILYHLNYPEKEAKYQSHKKFRLELVHQLVQPLLDVKAERNVYGTPGRCPDVNAARLQGKHFPESKHPDRKCCVVCGYKKKRNGKVAYTKTSNYCAKCEKFLCKNCFAGYHTKSNPKK